MKKRTQELLDKINEAHDWQEGQTHGGSGTQLSSTDRCRVCGLARRWFSDRQNGVDGEYTFADSRGNTLTLREAADWTC